MAVTRGIRASVELLENRSFAAKGLKDGTVIPEFTEVYRFDAPEVIHFGMSASEANGAQDAGRIGSSGGAKLAV